MILNRYQLDIKYKEKRKMTKEKMEKMEEMAYETSNDELINIIESLAYKGAKGEEERYWIKLVVHNIKVNYNWIKNYLESIQNELEYFKESIEREQNYFKRRQIL